MQNGDDSRKRLFCVLRKHGNENVVHYLNLGLIRGSDFDEDISCLCRNF